MNMSTVYIGIGSNLGNRKANIEKAMDLVRMIKGVTLTRISTIYETEPVGGPAQGAFLNGVFEIRTNLGPAGLLQKFKDIERSLGRKKSAKNGPRQIDLDILLFGRKRVDTRTLKIPHPRMHKREFVLRGLRELGVKP